MHRELGQIYNGCGRPLIESARRFPAVDARDVRISPSELEIETHYSLADQLYVEPQPAILPDQINVDQPIEMTRQEVAVALSHIEVWKRIASGDSDHTLVLEDDVCFCRDFAKYTDRAWADLKDAFGYPPAFDILYLSYQEVRNRARKSDISDVVFKLYCGLWHLSGYVLSKRGADKLLSLLPVRGPIDLWINHQLETLNAVATSKSVINQRWDTLSDNSYSVLPILSKIGILKNEKPVLLKSAPLREPVFAVGGSGMTSLAMALSMLGYRCCSDVNDLPANERECLFRKKRGRVFDAYVNVGSLEGRFDDLAKIYPGARFIVTAEAGEALTKVNHDILNGESAPTRAGSPGDIHRLACPFREARDKLLILEARNSNDWKAVCEFLGYNPPLSPYPALVDLMQRRLLCDNLNGGRNEFPRTRRLKFDALPWIAISNRDWVGVPSDGAKAEAIVNPGSVSLERFERLENSAWLLRDDTFPSNLALFRPANFSTLADGSARFRLHKERAGVRDYTSASICSRRTFLYGRFEAAIRPANVSGAVTGIFLHRNSPRQEIDIEFVGKDTTKVLLNVYYNPGADGARFEYGYRGTPVLVDLGFDASEDYHDYRIEWSPSAIRWFVDNRIVFERFNWEPTPIPHLPMQFQVNLWASRSFELAGRLSDRRLPCSSAIRRIRLETGA